MFEVFACFRRWCDANGIAPDQMRLDIVPLTADSAERFSYAWKQEMHAMQRYPRDYQLLVTGRMHGVPFEYKGFTPPFGGRTKGRTWPG